RPLVLFRWRCDDAQPLLRRRRHLKRPPRQPAGRPTLEPARLRPPPPRRPVALVLTRLRADALARRPTVRAQPRSDAGLLRPPRPVRPPQLPGTGRRRRPARRLLDRPQLLRRHLRPGRLQRRPPTLRPARRPETRPPGRRRRPAKPALAKN